MSGRGTMTSRTTVSPKSMIEWMKPRSSCSITSSSWATSAMASSSDSVTLPCASSSPLRRPMSRLASPIKHRGDGAHRGEAHQRPTRWGRRTGRPARGCGRPSSWARLEEDEDHHHLEDGGDHHPEAPEPPPARTPDQGGRDQLADEHQQEDRVQEPLGVLDQAHQRRAPRRLRRRGATWPSPGVRTRLVSARARRPETDQQHHDDGDQRSSRRAGSAGGGDHGTASPVAAGSGQRPGGSGPAAPARARSIRLGLRVDLVVHARAGAAGRARPAAPSRRRPSPRARSALRAATAGQITTSPSRTGGSSPGSAPGPVPPASGERPPATGSSSMGKASTSVGPGAGPGTARSSAAMAVSSTKSSDTSASPFTPRASSTLRASVDPAAEVDGAVGLLVGGEDVNRHRRPGAPSAGRAARRPAS